MSGIWILAITLVLVVALWFHLLFYALHAERVLRNLVEALETQGDEEDLVRLHDALQAARKVVGYAPK